MITWTWCLNIAFIVGAVLTWWVSDLVPFHMRRELHKRMLISFVTIVVLDVVVFILHWR